MGQQSSLRKANKPHKNSEKLSSVTEARVGWDADSVLRPNGFFPPEIIVHILKHVNTITCIRSSQTCKQWYESSVYHVYKYMYMERYGTLDSSESEDINWQVNFRRRALMDQNLSKGLWWAEALSSHYFPQLHRFSYVASFEGNKVIFNNHHIFMSSMQSNKFFEAAYLLDLETMTQESIPYGTIFANGFKLKSLVCNDEHYFDWRKFEVNDGTTTRTITRKFPIEEARNRYYEIYVNMDGSPTVLIVNEEKYTMERLFMKQLEFIDLRSGDVIAQTELHTSDILGFIGDEVIVFETDLEFINIYTKEKRQILVSELLYAPRIYYCKETNLLACCVIRKREVQFYSWPDLALDYKATIDLSKVIPLDTELMAPQILALAFDKSKIVLAVATEAPYFAVFDLHTKELIQTFYNTSDSIYYRYGINLAPNGKIVTDIENLTVYDFASSKIYQNIPVIVAEAKQSKGTLSSKIIKKKVAAVEIGKFVERQLDNWPIQHYTFFKQDNEGRQYRITAIASRGDKPVSWEKEKEIDWAQLSDYLAAWESQDEVRNTFQLTFSNQRNPKRRGEPPSITWNRISKVVLVYELLNETNEWEFSEPIGIEELLDKDASVIEK